MFGTRKGLSLQQTTFVGKREQRNPDDHYGIISTNHKNHANHGRSHLTNRNKSRIAKRAEAYLYASSADIFHTGEYVLDMMPHSFRLCFVRLRYQVVCTIYQVTHTVSLIYIAWVKTDKCMWLQYSTICKTASFGIIDYRHCRYGQLPWKISFMNDISIQMCLLRTHRQLNIADINFTMFIVSYFGSSDIRLLTLWHISYSCAQDYYNWNRLTI